jgi:hypothetical protein
VKACRKNGGRRKKKEPLPTAARTLLTVDLLVVNTKRILSQLSIFAADEGVDSRGRPCSFDQGAEVLAESAPVRKHVLHASRRVLSFGRVRSAKHDVLPRCAPGILRARGSVLPEWMFAQGVHVLRNHIVRSGLGVLFRVK